MSTSSTNGAEPITIREAQVEDAPAMGRLMVTTFLITHRNHIPLGAWERRRAQWTPAVSAAAWERDLRARDAAPDQTRTCYLVAEDQHPTVIAVAAAAAAEDDPTGTIGEVGSLYVNFDHQRRGIGRRLVRQLAEVLTDKGFRSLRIGVLTANLDGCRFYEALGGQFIGERLIDEHGALLPERIYAWPDITSLLEAPARTVGTLGDLARSE